MIGVVPLDPTVGKLLAKGQTSAKKRKRASIVVVSPTQQSTEHRLMYLNPKERARRDLENRHGKNVV